MPGKERPTLGTSIIFGDKTLFEIATDILLSGAPRSTRRIAAPVDLKPCRRCGYYECCCGTDAFENWLRSHTEKPDSIDIPVALDDEREP